MHTYMDKKTIERDGCTVVVYKTADESSNPVDDGDYEDEVINAWQNNEWRYVGIVAKAYCGDVMLGESSLWSCEEGHLPGVDSYVDAYGHTLGEHEGDYDVPGDAIAEAKKALTTLLTNSVSKARAEARVKRMRDIVSEWEDIRGKGDRGLINSEGSTMVAMLDELRNLIRAEEDDQ